MYSPTYVHRYTFVHSTRNTTQDENGLVCYDVQKDFVNKSGSSTSKEEITHTPCPHCTTAEEFQ